ncbi:sulfite exporter TauE/SafE family protein [Bacillus sp. FJAT-44742]|uniref:sulfite exporter TauE/SafE family protein n=1 Tax=Bacillus sp. FJAT-44742 TaxID=2014005 RepID=UPI001E44A083|nr:sulfite exporter TauE/SafE family protein [Bacillus sp. FJAT-44742]
MAMIIILLLIGLLAGVLASLVGIGGGLIIVPALLFLGTYTLIIPEISPQLAVGTSMVVVLATGLSSTLAYMKQKKVDYKSGLYFFIGSGPGAVLGAYVNSFFDFEGFSIIFGFFILGISILLMLRHRLKPFPLKQSIQREWESDTGETTLYGYSLKVAIPIAFFVGGVSGLFGIGGGTIMVPVMIMIFLFPPHVAVATSMFMIFLSAITGSITHVAMGNVEWLYVFLLTAGAWIGAKVGANLNQRLNSESIVFLLRLVLILVALRLIWEGSAPFFT